MPPTAPSVSRVTVVESVYHQMGQDAPVVGSDTRFQRELKSTEQAFVRRCRVGEEWKPVNCGWIESAGMIVIKNEEGRFNFIPTEEEREAVARRIILLTYKGQESSPWIIPPGESFRGYPAKLEGLIVRCLSGEAKFTLTLIPE